MYEDRDDPAWDEYLNTGTDPTGGGLGVDDDSDSEDGHPEQPFLVDDVVDILGGVIGILLLMLMVGLCS